jgi:hypothetical protein
MKKDCSRFTCAFEKGVTLKLSEPHPIIEGALRSIRSNMITVRKIEDISDEDLDTFLQNSRVFNFNTQRGVGIGEILDGLSSFDGTRSYLNDGEFHLSDPTLLQKTLEHELMHNIARWRKDDVRRISPCKNKKLRIRGKMVEAGDFYEYEVYHQRVSDPCPFCLSEIWRKDY